MRDLIKFQSVDQYLEYQPDHVQPLLSKLRQTIRKAAPGAGEVISYNMPGYKLEGSLVYFAAYEHHIGFYPTPSAIREFEGELKNYSTAKGTIHFSLNEPLPVALITRIVKFRVKENLEQAQLKKQIRKVRK